MIPNFDALLSQHACGAYKQREITIPLAIRQQLNLKAGNVLDFDEHASVLTARQVIPPEAWQKLREGWQDPWPEPTTKQVLNEQRGAVELPPSPSVDSNQKYHGNRFVSFALHP